MFTPGFSETTALLAVLEHKSFTKAANQLGLSPARISELVRNLEERLGMRLIERTTRSVAATMAGEHLRERLRPLLEDYQATLESLNDFRSKPAGPLRLTVAPFAADFILAPLVAPFVAQYPEISLDISVERAFVDIVEGRFDAGIRNGERIARDMIAVRISDEMPFAVAASPDYIAQHGRPQTPGDLTKHACIRFRFPSGVIAPWRFNKKGRAFEVAVDGPLTATEPAIGIRAAVDGVGLIKLPLVFLAPEFAAGRLVPLLDNWDQPKIEGFHIYYPSRRQIRAPLKAFVGFLRDAYRRTKAEQKTNGAAARAG